MALDARRRFIAVKVDHHRIGGARKGTVKVSFRTLTIFLLSLLAMSALFWEKRCMGVSMRRNSCLAHLHQEVTEAVRLD